MIVSAVERGSMADIAGITVGDNLISINGQKVNDVLDYMFYISEPVVNLVIRREGKLKKFIIEKSPDNNLGMSFNSMKIKRCINKCIFCYIDQLPSGLRPSLYIKDEDYRLSFLHGNYVTLSNISAKELSRIVKMRLSPIYVSVHSTVPEVRKFMLGREKDDRIMEKLKFLVSKGINLNLQIVLCPGINDGESLEKTLKDLYKLIKGIESIAIVPVGLTRYRGDLCKIDHFNEKHARDIIKKAEVWNHQYSLNGRNFLYLSDEIFLLAGMDIPESSYYDNFPQIENGVGMVRKFMDELEKCRKYFPKKLKRGKRVSIVTGTLAEKFLPGTLLRELARIQGLEAHLFPVKNRFLGESITVSGLLAGRDICRQLKFADPGDRIVLPPNCLNQEKFLDDLTLKDVENRLGIEIAVFNGDFKIFYES